MLTKDKLDRRVALTLGVPTQEVAKYTDAFIDELCNAITLHGGFILPGLGKLVPKIEKGGGGTVSKEAQEYVRVRLYFTKSRLLKDQIERQFGIKESTNGQEL